MEISYSLEEIPKVAQKILKVSPSKTLLFFGEMGAGKTTLIKEIVKQLGSSDKVSSPTFSLVNEYFSEDKNIYHFDFYRIEDEHEAYDIGLEEYLEDENWCLIEWPEKIQSFLSEKFTKLTIEKINFSKRKITF